MENYLKKSLFVACIFFLSVFGCFAQDSLAPRKWFIVLPLRFTTLQNTGTMLSGVKLGRVLNERLHASLSIYHSFYLKSFKAPANLEGFDDQPRVFVNGMGAEMEYYLMKRKRVNLGVQLLVGWGFITYELKEKQFEGKQVNYLAAEPAINLEYAMSKAAYIGLGIGYRPIISNRHIVYTSEVSNGHIPVAKAFPNGLNLALTLKGFL